MFIGNGNIGGVGATRTFDATFIDDYETLTADNFAVKITGVSYSRTDNSSGGDGSSVSTSYSDGILTIKTTGNTNANSYGSGSVAFQVYCYY